MNKNVDINVTIKKNKKSISKLGKVILYNLNVIFNNNTKVKIIRDGMVATTKDRRRWLVFNIIAGILPITLLIILFSILTINSISNQSSILISIFWIVLDVILITILIFIVSTYYKIFKYKNKK